MTSIQQPSIDVRRAADRFATGIDWLDSKHSFSFGPHYDPRNTHHGLLLVNNDDVVAPGAGFETHPHRDMEIVTWVLRGQLVHQDSQGHNGVIYPGLAQRMSAGTGILHSEKNDAWRLDRGGRAHRPGPLRADVGRPRRRPASPRATSSSRSTTSCCAAAWSRWRPGWPSTTVASAIRIRNRYAALHAARLAPGRVGAAPGRAVPAPVRAPRDGRPSRARARCRPGDAVRFTGTGGQRVTAVEPAEILVWEMHAHL